MQTGTIQRSMKKHINGWLCISLPSAAILLLPIAAVLVSVFGPPNENWAHIRQFMLLDYALQSVWLVVFTGFFTVVIGTLLAWLIAVYDFPLKAFFRWALILPLAVPPYIAAYTYSNMLSYTGNVQKTLRELGVAVQPGWFDMMSIRGAIFIFTMFLYPYVFMITRSFLERQSGSYIENARLLGRKPLSIFLRVALPISRPAIVGGVVLVAFEVLSDYGVVNYYGVQTFTTAIFQTWFGMYDIESATRLAAWFMIGILFVIVLERVLRGGQRFSSTTGRGSPLVPIKLKGAAAWGATALCLAIFCVSFVIPVLQLLQWAHWTYADVLLTSDFWELTRNTITVAVTSTALIMVIAVLVANTSRMLNNGFVAVLGKSITAGYSVPGAIIAIGMLAVFIWLDRLLAPLYFRMGLGENPLVLSLSLVMLAAAYVVRFMATGYNAVEAGFERTGPKYFEAARMLGAGITRTFFKVDLPLLKGALLSGVILTFVEIVKELPLALLLRPFNFDTLATKAYQYAGDERIFAAAVPSLFIIGVSFISIIVFHQLGRREEQ
ncbi:ABC transporter permease [Paenibacillus thermotolerans]|uniref:ABC transporter permease n=1 Tax=Paenibacillus thermotolerans TaxID=3027807 RepID=UPI002367D0F3|nr:MULTISPECIES: iron ABC transporter permease [unclassified Paenibacillus]